MDIQRLNCIVCGARIHIPSGIERLTCSSCGTDLIVQRGEGYIALKKYNDDQVEVGSNVKKSTSQFDDKEVLSSLGQQNVGSVNLSSSSSEIKSHTKKGRVRLGAGCLSGCITFFIVSIIIGFGLVSLDLDLDTEQLSTIDTFITLVIVCVVFVYVAFPDSSVSNYFRKYRIVGLIGFSLLIMFMCYGVYRWNTDVFGFNPSLLSSQKIEPEPTWVKTPTYGFAVSLPQVVENGEGVNFRLESIDKTTVLKNSSRAFKSRNGTFLVLIGTLINESGQAMCINEDDFTLPEGNEIHTMGILTLDVASENYQIQNLGSSNGQCLPPEESEQTILVFDVPIDASDLRLKFDDTELLLGQTYYLTQNRPISLQLNTPTLEPSLTFTPTILPQPVFTLTSLLSPVVTETVSPTLISEQLPTITKTPTVRESIKLIINAPRIIGRSSDEVTSILGEPMAVTPNDDFDDILAGGEYWDYQLGKYWIMVILDSDGIARGVQVLDGLSDEDYSIHDWEELLPRFGLNVTSPPGREAPAALYWNNYSGYGIAIIAQGQTGKPVWTVQIEDAAVFGR